MALVADPGDIVSRNAGSLDAGGAGEHGVVGRDRLPCLRQAEESLLYLVLHRPQVD